MPKLPRAYTVDSIGRIKFQVMEFEGKFKASFGLPQLGCTWFIWGDTSNGKTSLCMQLAKYMTRYSKVLYNTYEEQISLSLQNAMHDHEMLQVSDSFWVLPGEDVSTLMERLSKRNAPNIIFMDSVQHAQLTKLQYKKLKSTFPNKLFIYVSHARGKSPKGEVADFIKFDADIKARVEGFRAMIEGRLNKAEGQFFDIYTKKSKEYWSEL